MNRRREAREAASSAGPSSSGATDEVEYTGMRTREDRDAELLQHAVSVDDE